MLNRALYMKRKELNDIAGRGGVAVLPTGSLEQHGSHLPIGTDSLLAEEVASEAVSKATEGGTEAVVFPAIWTGFSPHHVPLGGTVTIEKETMIALLEDVCESLIDIGFNKILLVNGHGGNRPIVSLVAGDLGTSQNSADVAELPYVMLGEDIFNSVRVGDIGSAFHAGEVETSLMMYLFDDLVDLDSAQDDSETPLTSYSPEDMFEGGPLGMRRTYDELTESGVRGEPTKAKKSNGELIFEEITDNLAELISEFEEI